MPTIKQYSETLTRVLEQLPEDKVVEVVALDRVANYLLNRYSNSHIDTASLLAQQEALKKIWDNPEEDVYEL